MKQSASPYAQLSGIGGSFVKGKRQQNDLPPANLMQIVQIATGASPSLMKGASLANGGDDPSSFQGSFQLKKQMGMAPLQKERPVMVK